MGEVAIRVENLGKRYKIGQRVRPKSFGEMLTGLIRTPFNEAKLGLRKPPAQDGFRQCEGMVWALKDLTFEVAKGEILGVIGRNGAGKSTLLKILSRITRPTRGYAVISGRVGSLLEVGTGFHGDLTGRENIYLNGAFLGMRKTEIDRKFDEIIAFAETERFLDTPVKHYSSGMYMRLAFAVAAHLETEILFVDEVLAVGDVAFQKKCLGRIGEVAKDGRTVVFVSHNMAAIERLCTKGLYIDKGVGLSTSSVREAIGLYLGDSCNEVNWDNEIISKASIRQNGEQIEIDADYKFKQNLEIPCLGFVISDYLGNPICGTNPLIDAVPIPMTSTNAGRVHITLESPKLLNGTYRLSLWFGDGRVDYFHRQDCITFDVVNMAGLKQLPASSVGPVAPKCHWHFS
ncbi:MAG: ABC transporter ATP-binding protein [Nitrospira sp.]|nr:MAG: ABC transporter ATP-binding protein [Nitrospira sp.]